MAFEQIMMHPQAEFVTVAEIADGDDIALHANQSLVLNFPGTERVLNDLNVSGVISAISSLLLLAAWNRPNASIC